MKLDWADGFETAAADTTTVTTVVPAGRHFGEIKSVKVNPGWKITDRNPSGDVLSIGIDFGTASQKMEWIWQAIPTNWPRKIIEVCQCAVAVNPQPNVDWDEQCLLGLTVFCETDTFILQNVVCAKTSSPGAGRDCNNAQADASEKESRDIYQKWGRR